MSHNSFSGTGGNFDPTVIPAEVYERGEAPSQLLERTVAGYFDGLDHTVEQQVVRHVEGRPKDTITITSQPGIGYRIDTRTDVFAKLAPRETEVVTGTSSTTTITMGVVRPTMFNGEEVRPDPRLDISQSNETWAMRLNDRLARSEDGPKRRRAVGGAIGRIFFPRNN